MTRLTAVLLTFFWASSCLGKDMDKDEAGLRMLVENHEQFLRNSPTRVRDESIDSFLQKIVCDLTPERCSEFRIYVLNQPGLNAFILPNGAMFVQSGLLLRMTSTSELAFVLAHEIVHYTNKHTLENVRRRNKTNNAFAVLGTVVSTTGAIAAATSESYEDAWTAIELSASAQLMLASAQVFAAFQLIAFQREDEQESDTEGFEMLVNAGYNPNGAYQIWWNQITEERVAGKERGFSFLSTHPMQEERLKYLRELAESKVDEESTRAALPDDWIFRHVTRDTRMEWLSGEARSLHPNQFRGLMGNQRKFTDIPEGYFYYLLGKSWQIRANRQGLTKRQIQESVQESLFAFESAANSEFGMPVEGYRELAQMAESVQNDELAVDALEKYLLAAPDAWDAKFVARKIDQLSN